MSCEHRHDAAAYVLGALDPPERARFETHRRHCPECEAELRSLAGIPGVLARVSPADVSAEPVPPPDMLTELFRQVGADRRRRRLRTLFVAAAAVVLVAVGAVAAVEVTHPQQAVVTTPVTIAAEFESVVGADVVWGEAELVAYPEGTQIRVDCSYDISDNYGPRPYRLLVFNQAGDSEVAGSWRTDNGASRQVTLFTRWAPEDIAAMEIQDLEGYTVLRWTSD